jgi:molybdopterin converting factor small subunit
VKKHSLSTNVKINVFNHLLENNNMAKRILVKYGGHLSRLTKREEEWIESETRLSIDGLLMKIADKYPRLTGSSLLDFRFAFLITVNGEFFPSSSLEGVIIKDGDVICLFPAVSGG